MASHTENNSYKQGHSDHTTSTHRLRTAESDAAFLLPYIRKTDHILDVGCGPGTITTGFAKYASEGRVVGIDISEDVLQTAKMLGAASPVVFEQGNILEKVGYPDESFDIIYCSQVFGHLPPPDLPLKALAEIRRVLKPGGLLATRDATAQHFYPRSLDLDRLWVQNLTRVLHKGVADMDPTGPRMPSLLRLAGFDADGGKVHLGVGSTIFSGLETRKWLARRATGQLNQGDPFYQSWLDTGITNKEIQETLHAVARWVETEDAWYAALQCEMLAWK
ncbi:hypothetical protein FH972_022869 [Carpinus fangiana]|uniref:Methyltransferase type 11 domain-containing protein n=1 Tax=Carpinus fangiana TaxID=176857 RepID=A0A5N6KTT6_9ROSI|nr:hypothetical protein FH972_022869 [Carpinus fangiana]